MAYRVSAIRLRDPTIKDWVSAQEFARLERVEAITNAMLNRRSGESVADAMVRLTGVNPWQATPREVIHRRPQVKVKRTTPVSQIVAYRATVLQRRRANELKRRTEHPTKRERAWNVKGRRAQQSQTIENAWRDHDSTFNTATYRAKLAAASARVWSDPAQRKRVSRSVKASWTPERRAAHVENMRKRWADPEYHARASRSNKESRTPEVRAQIAVGMRKARSGQRQLEKGY